MARSSYIYLVGEISPAHKPMTVVALFTVKHEMKSAIFGMPMIYGVWRFRDGEVGDPVFMGTVAEILLEDKQ